MVKKAKFTKVFAKAIFFPVFVFMDEEDYFVARNLVFDISTQARSYQDALSRIKQATIEYLQVFPKEIERLKEINIEASSFSNIELHPNDIKAPETVIRQ